MHYAKLKIAASNVRFYTLYMGSESFQHYTNRIGSIGLSWWGFSICALLLSHLLFINWTPADPDLFARLAMGRLVLESGAVPDIDQFAWTPRLERWIDHEWLSGVIFYLLHHYGGDWTLYLFKLLMVTATAVVLRACYSIHRPITGIGAFTIALILFASSFLWFSTVRCQVFTYLFLSFALYAIESHRITNNRWPLFALIAIMPVWTNLHGGFVLGLIFVGCYVVAQLLSRSDTWKFSSLVLVGLAATTLLNPYGYEYWRFIIEALGKPRPMIAEWSAVNPFSLRGSVIAFMFLVVTWSLWKERKLAPWSTVLILAFSFYSGFRHARLIPLALISAVALQPSAIEDFYSRIKSGVKSLSIDLIVSGATALLVLSGGVSFFTFLTSHANFSLNYSTYPVNAVAWMKNNLPPGKVLNPFDQGSYILWEGYPHLLISIDGRYEEVYPEETFAENLAFYKSDKLNRIATLEKLKPDYILSPLKLQLIQDELKDNWKVAYSDADWIVLSRLETAVH